MSSAESTKTHSEVYKSEKWKENLRPVKDKKVGWTGKLTFIGN